MRQNTPRFDPMQILDADWRKRTWKGWLRSRWLGVEDAQPTAPLADVSPTMAPPPFVPTTNTVASASVQGRDVEGRRPDLRSRFDGLADRLGIIEDSLEALVKRFALNSIHQRRYEQRLLERFDSNAEMLERQTLALESMQASLQRVEQRVERLERRLRDDGKWFDSAVGELRENRAVLSHPEYEDYSDLEQAFTSERLSGSRSVLPPSLDSSDVAASSGPSIHGNLSEMSLGTVLAMLELERRTGLLQVTSEDGTIVTATLRGGAIVGARRREVEADPVEVVREALRFKDGFFWFRQSGVEIASGPPRSVGAVLLEATSRNDEAARTG